MPPRKPDLILGEDAFTWHVTRNRASAPPVTEPAVDDLARGFDPGTRPGHLPARPLPRPGARHARLESVHLPACA